jgi:hypothetical protein
MDWAALGSAGGVFPAADPEVEVVVAWSQTSGPPNQAPFAFGSAQVANTSAGVWS